jgi:hypothetical protein
MSRSPLHAIQSIQLNRREHLIGGGVPRRFFLQ